MHCLLPADSFDRALRGPFNKLRFAGSQLPWLSVNARLVFISTSTVSSLFDFVHYKAYVFVLSTAFFVSYSFAALYFFSASVSLGMIT
ncbi:MAG TPA: hypothetical protein VN381_11370, partial [Anaerovoracaceae bacterium]|nr:hypothetical protein [Anaerovoracaceae bacterium]